MCEVDRSKEKLYNYEAILDMISKQVKLPYELSNKYKNYLKNNFTKNI